MKIHTAALVILALSSCTPMTEDSAQERADREREAWERTYGKPAPTDSIDD